MGATSPRDLGPGLHVLREADPEPRASSLAAELGAELCRTTGDVERLLAARQDLAGLDAATLDRLGDHARRLERAHGVLERTRQRAEAAAAGRLSAAHGLAVHPDTVRERAARVVEAREALQAAEAALSAQAAPEATTRDEPEPAADPPEADPAPSPTPAAVALRLQRNRAVGVLVAAFGLGLILLALGVLPLWAALIPPLLAALWAMRALRPAAGAGEGPSEESTHLSQVGAFTDELFGRREQTWEHGAEAARLSAARSHADEELRVAERAWHDLAGADADPAEVEAVVRRFDPQHEEAAVIATESVGVRAVEAARQQLVDGWVDAWRGLGREAPPAAGAEGAVTALRHAVGRGVVLVGEAAARADEVVRAVPTAPVVVLEGAPG